MSECRTWLDHCWAAPRFIESGKSPTMGRYQKYLVRCDNCQKETTQTEWLDLLRPVGREGAEA